MVLSVLIFHNCAEEYTPIPISPKKSYKRKLALNKLTTPKVEPIQQKEIYLYSPVGKRDPFKSYFTSFKKKAVTFTPTPLQKYELDRLKIVGIITGISSPRAMVEDPDGQSYIIRQGALIGKNYGKVKLIRSSEVVVHEEYRDFTGKKVITSFFMKMNKDDSEDMQ